MEKRIVTSGKLGRNLKYAYDQGYSHGRASAEVEALRVLAALCKQNGGELRISTDLLISIPINVVVNRSKDWAREEIVFTLAN